MSNLASKEDGATLKFDFFLAKKERMVIASILLSDQILYVYMWSISKNMCAQTYQNGQFFSHLNGKITFCTL